MKKIIKGAKYVLFLFLTIAALTVLFFGYKDIPLEKLKEKYTDKTSSFISMEGMNVHYRDEGNKLDTLPIVLIHGTGASLQTFDAWSEELSKSKRVIRMDLPAYGLTGPFPDRNYSISHYSTFINNFLKNLGIKQCILAGNSLGGRIAWNFALNEPEKVVKLILIDAAGYPIKSKRVPIGFQMAKLPVINNISTYITPRFMVKSSLETVYYDKSKISDELIDRYFELTLRKGNRHAFVDRVKETKKLSSHSEIKNIYQPTLILWGANDLLIPVENAYKFQQDLPNNKLVILKNSGHVPMEENPQESLKIVADFIQTSN